VLFSGVDILINNAGRHLMKYNQPFGELARADVRGLFDVNVTLKVSGGYPLTI
jgi:3-oxoacyl-[acyl-carrier protein] reductase